MKPVIRKLRYDGGFSGGNIERPALKSLLADIEAGRVDIVCVYKIARLSRSLMDFARLVEVFNRKGGLYKLLSNRVYIGEAIPKGASYPGEHEPLIERSVWDRVQAIFASAPRTRTGSSRAQTPALLKWLLFGSTGCAMTPTHTRRGGKLYRYYVRQATLKDREDCPIRRGPAGEIETAHRLCFLAQHPKVDPAKDAWPTKRRWPPTRKTTMTIKINSLLRLSLISALGAVTVPAVPTIVLAAENPEYCGSPTFAGFVPTADIGTDCAGSRTLFFGNCEADAHFVFVIAEQRNGVTTIDCRP